LTKKTIPVFLQKLSEEPSLQGLLGIHNQRNEDIKKNNSEWNVKNSDLITAKNTTTKIFHDIVCGIIFSGSINFGPSFILASFILACLYFSDLLQTRLFFPERWEDDMIKFLKSISLARYKICMLTPPRSSLCPPFLSPRLSPLPAPCPLVFAKPP
jgi:hypothetical protein